MKHEETGGTLAFTPGFINTLIDSVILQVIELHHHIFSSITTKGSFSGRKKVVFP